MTTSPSNSNSDSNDSVDRAPEHSLLEHSLNREREHLMNFAYRNIPAFIVLYDRDLKIRFVNQPLLKAFNLTAAEIIGKTATDGLDATSWGVTEINLRHALAGENQIYENTVQRKNGTPLEVLVQLVPETNQQGQSTGVCSLIIDVTALKKSRGRLHEDEFRFKDAFEGSSVGIVESDFARPDWIFADHIENLLGFPQGYFQNSRKRLREQIHPDDLFANDQARQNEEMGQGTRIEIRLKTAAGKFRWYSIISRLKSNEDGRPAKLIGTISDIDDLKKSQLKSAEDLKRRDEFLAMLSHELRNPMAAITFSLDCLDHNKQLTGDSLKLIDIISRQTTQMSKLLQDLLDVSRVTQNRMVNEPTVHDLNTSIEEIVPSIQPSIARKRQTLNVRLSDQPALVFGDVARLKQAMTNLLDNASKYTPESGEIWLETERQADKVLFTIRDNGFGIESEVLKNIFELFYQAHQPLHRKSGGIGVGLYLVDQICKSHSGTISVTSDGAGQGSQFVLTLPQSTEPLLAPIPWETQNFSGRRIMLVEGNADSRNSLIHLLQQIGFEVVDFVDGQSAANQLPKLKFDVAVIDIGLPGTNGLELAGRIRRTAHLKNSVLIAMTGYNSLENQSASPTHGFDVHLIKPTNFSQLCATIANLLGERT